MKGPLQPGERWTEHYRGTKYHFNSKKEFWWESPVTEDGFTNLKALAREGHETIIEELLKLKPVGGTCRITETAEVLTKRDKDMEPVYVVDLGEPIIFPGLDLTGNNLEPKDLWTGFYDGARYSFNRGSIWWKDPTFGSRIFVREKLPGDIQQVLNELKPEGGSFRINENGMVITLIPPQPMPTTLKEQFEKLSPTQKNFLAVKVKNTKMLPVYVGLYTDGFTLGKQIRLDDPLSGNDRALIHKFLNKYNQSFEELEPAFRDFKDDSGDDTE